MRIRSGKNDEETWKMFYRSLQQKKPDKTEEELKSAIETIRNKLEQEQIDSRDKPTIEKIVEAIAKCPEINQSVESIWNQINYEVYSNTEYFMPLFKITEIGENRTKNGKRIKDDAFIQVVFKSLSNILGRVIYLCDWQPTMLCDWSDVFLPENNKISKKNALVIFKRDYLFHAFTDTKGKHTFLHCCL